MEEQTGDPMDALVNAIEQSEPDEDVLDEEVTDEADEPTSEAEEPTEEAEEPDEEPEAKQPRYKVKVDDELGGETEKAVTFEELKSGYQEAIKLRKSTTEQVTKAQQEAFGYASQVEQKAMQRLAEMDQLIKQALDVAASDQISSLTDNPAEYIKHIERTRMLESVQRRIQESQGQITHQQQMARAQEAQKAEALLASRGIPREQIGKIYENAVKAFKVQPQTLAANLDPALVLALKDALAYRALQDKKPQVQNKVREAPKPPPSRTKLAQSETQNLVSRLSKKGGTRDDLAALLARI